MEKNEFLTYNDLIGRLYACRSHTDLVPGLLLPLKMLIHYSYASIFLTNPDAGDSISDLATSLLPDPICCPAYFSEAERSYLEHIDEDRTLWLIQSPETSLIRESDLFSAAERKSGPLYEHCYKKYNVDDIMHITIVYNQQFLGILSLFRTEEDGCFTGEDLFYLRALGLHLGRVFHQFQKKEPESMPSDSRLPDFNELSAQFHLTARETQILEQVLRFQSPEEISELLEIRTNTLQKHLQNLFRKMNVTSRWELLRFRKN